MTTTNIEIRYSAVAQSLILPSALATKMAAVALPTGPDGDITQIADVTLLSDVTAAVGTTVTRTIHFTPGPNFPRQFPITTDLKGQQGPFFNLYTAILANALSCVVTADDPILT